MALNSAQLIATGQLDGFRNRIINGAMAIDQRNAGASVTPTADGTYTLDRWRMGIAQASKLSVIRSAVAPTGFNFSTLVTSLSAYTVGAAETFLAMQFIEGFNTADLMWGTVNAQSVTLSFWVRSSLTGTFGGAINNSAFDRSYPFSYSISSANTWEKKTITIPGDTSGTWIGAADGIGLSVSFSVGTGTTRSTAAGAWAAGTFYSVTGATSVVGTDGATWHITGVQLEKGPVATDFDFRSFGQELGLCKRYYANIRGSLSTASSTSADESRDGSNQAIPVLMANFIFFLKYDFFLDTPMRAGPSCAVEGNVRILTSG
jgi:hypothetical protein